jgi:aminoglycoside 6'-N-acetyltransferase
MLVAWDEAPHVLAATGFADAESPEWEDLLTGAAPGWAHFVAELHGEDPTGAPDPIGVVQIVDPSQDPDTHWGPLATPAHRSLHIWIGPAHRLGHGLGPAMMQAAIDRCFADPAVDAILIDPLASNHRAIAFYRRLGFADIGPRQVGPDRIFALRLPRQR